MEKRQSVRSLFLKFLKLGCFTFGGGWSIIAQIREEYVRDKSIVTDEELLDLTSVGRSLPGIMVENVTMLFGYRCAGLWGGLACVLGLSAAPMVLLSLITLCYTAFRDSYWVAAAMEGVRVAVVPIIFCAAIPLTKGIGRGPGAVLVAGLSLGAYLLGAGSIWIMLAGAACGLLMRCVDDEGGQKE